ncbi:MAG: hypothetical protein ABI939_12535 [Anaerolineaceae bacterium]
MKLPASPAFSATAKSFTNGRISKTEEWRSFTSEWWRQFETNAVKVSELIVTSRERLPALFIRTRDDASERSLKTTLGKALAKRQDRTYGTFAIRRAGEDARNGGTLWRLEHHDCADVPPEDDQTSAELPQANRPISDTNAEHAELADVDSRVMHNFWPDAEGH